MSRHKTEKEIVPVLLNKQQLNSVLAAALEALRKEQAKRYGPWKHEAFWEDICDRLIQARKDPGVLPQERRGWNTSGNEVVTVLLIRRQVDRLGSPVGDMHELIVKSNKFYLVRQPGMAEEEKYWSDIMDILIVARRSPAAITE